MMMVWKKTDINNDFVRDLASQYDLDLLTAAILTRRDITKPDEIWFFLEKDFRHTHNPFLFKDMEDAVSRILSAKDEGEKVLIFGDRDVDGITSIVLLYETLTRLGISTAWSLPMGDDPYGLSMKAVDRFDKEGGTLIITVDCGISNIKEIAYAAEKGIDVIVIDHHNPPEELPPAAAIINPKMSSSGYPFRDLAGCGVVSKVCWALGFAQTELFNQTLCLLNVHPGNESFVLDAVKLVNLVETDRVTEVIVPGLLDMSKSRAVKFLEGMQIFVYDAEAQKKMLKKIFGPHVDIHLGDLQPEISKAFPSVSGKSLLKLREQSKSARYSPKLPGELDIFINLFTSFVMSQQQDLSCSHEKAMDLVALGTLADLMPLANENRILVRKGMEVLNSTSRMGLKELIIRQNLIGKRLTTNDVSWQISPVINASGRMGEPDKAVRLLLTGELTEREQLAVQIIELNKERKKLGDMVWAKILPQAKESVEKHEGKLVFISDDSMHRGITGIIAARLVNFFKLPAVVVAFLSDNAVGSLRSPGNFDVTSFLENSSDILEDYGGHDCAAGFTMKREQFPEFEERVFRYIQTLDLKESPEEVLEIDAEIPLHYLTPKLGETVDLFEPYGEGNPRLTFMSKGVKIAAMDIIGKNGGQHLKLTIDAGKHKWPAVYWNAAEKVGQEFALYDTVDIVYQISRNYFQNTETLQLNLLDVKR